MVFITLVDRNQIGSLFRKFSQMRNLSNGEKFQPSRDSNSRRDGTYTLVLCVLYRLSYRATLNDVWTFHLRINGFEIHILLVGWQTKPLQRQRFYSPFKVSSLTVISLTPSVYLQHTRTLVTFLVFWQLWKGGFYKETFQLIERTIDLPRGNH